jgi:hypothetical protein
MKRQRLSAFTQALTKQAIDGLSPERGIREVAELSNRCLDSALTVRSLQGVTQKACAVVSAS